MYYISYALRTVVNTSLLQDMVISAVFVLSLLSGGAASAAYSSDNDDFYDDYASICKNRYANRYDIVEDTCNDIQRVRDSEAASAVSYEALLAHTISTYSS